MSFGFDSSVSDVNIGMIDKEGKKYVMEEFMDEFNPNKVKIFIAEFANSRGKRKSSQHNFKLQLFGNCLDTKSNSSKAPSLLL